MKIKRASKSQFNEYKEIHQAAQKSLNENGYDEKGIGTLEKNQNLLMINMQTQPIKHPHTFLKCSLSEAIWASLMR
jgi:hypothetical protein